MITLLCYFVVICLILWAVKYLVPMDPPLAEVFYVVSVLIAVGFLFYALRVSGLFSGRLPSLR